MSSSPKKPKPTSEELVMRQRQIEQLTQLDEDENRRLKGLTRMRLGFRSLLGGKGRVGSSPASSAPAAVAPQGRPGGGGKGPLA